MEIKRHETKARMSKAVIYNNTVYLCGQTAADKTVDVKEQTKSVLDKVDALLAEVGSNKDKVLSATIYLRDIADFNKMNEIWDAWVNEGFAPARACVEARMASPGILVEVSIVAAV